MSDAIDRAPSDSQIDDWLDSEHNAIIDRVLAKDTTESRRELARLFGSELTDEIAALEAEQTTLGTREQMAALLASGWVTWAWFFVAASWLVALVDALIWAFGAARVLTIQ